MTPQEMRANAHRGAISALSLLFTQSPKFLCVSVIRVSCQSPSPSALNLEILR
jgi:hypothetical protein